MGSIGTFYWLIILGSSGLFLWNPGTSSFYGIGISVVHWPARLLRWLRVGEYLDSLTIPACDWILSIIGEHPIIQVVTLIVLSLLILGALGFFSEIVWDADSLMPLIIGTAISICLCLLWFSWTSAYFSGMHLSRAYANLREMKSVDMHVTIMSDLLLGMEPINEDAPDRVIHRLTKISQEDILLEPSLVKDPHLARLQQQILEFPKRLRNFIKSNGPPSVMQQSEFIVYVTDIAIRLQLARFLRIAEEGREVNPDLEPRTLRFNGPLGPIVIKTNFQPPDPLWLPLVPGTQDGIQVAAQRIKEIAKGFPSDASTFFEEVDQLADVYDLTDPLIRIWYTTLAHFFIVRSFLEANLPGTDFPDVDINGELIIFLHNSCESYMKIMPTSLSSISSGSYFSAENEIHFWLNEKSISKINARHHLELSAARFSQIENMDKQQENQWLISMALKIPVDRISIALPHELTHWAMHALLGGTLRGQPQIPIAFDEGMAVLLDSEAKRYLASMRFNLGVEVYESEKSSGDCPTYQSHLDWGCRWIKQETHSTGSPADLINLDAKAFADTKHYGKNYNDAWALVYLFGTKILRNALQSGNSIKETAQRDPLLPAPWLDLQSAIKNKKVPEDMWRRFERCF